MQKFIERVIFIFVPTKNLSNLLSRHSEIDDEIISHSDLALSDSFNYSKKSLKIYESLKAYTINYDYLC